MDVVVLVPSGGKGSWGSTVARCDFALRHIRGLQESGHKVVVVVSGGTKVLYKNSTDAEYLAGWFKLHHIECLVENRALDTYQNIEFSLGVLNKQGIKCDKLFVVSQRRHLRCLRLTAESYREIRGKVVYKEAWWPEESVLQESLLWLIHFLDRRGRSLIARLNRKRRAKQFGPSSQSRSI